MNSYWGWVGILEPEYDLLEGYTLIDVDSYYRQSISRKLALAFRNGGETVGDNQEVVKYITRRAGQGGCMAGTTLTSVVSGARACRHGRQTGGDNQVLAKYITGRAGQVGYMTGPTFKGLLKEVLFNLY